MAASHLTRELEGLRDKVLAKGDLADALASKVGRCTRSVRSAACGDAGRRSSRHACLPAPRDRLLLLWPAQLSWPMLLARA